MFKKVLSMIAIVAVASMLFTATPVSAGNKTVNAKKVAVEAKKAAAKTAKAEKQAEKDAKKKQAKADEKAKRDAKKNTKKGNVFSVGTKVDGFGKKGLTVKVGYDDSGVYKVTTIKVDSSACATNNTKFTAVLGTSDMNATCDTTADSIVETNARATGVSRTGTGSSATYTGYTVEKADGSIVTIPMTCTLPGKTTVYSMEGEAQHLANLLNSGWKKSHFEPTKCRVVGEN